MPKVQEQISRHAVPPVLWGYSVHVTCQPRSSRVVIFSQHLASLGKGFQGAGIDPVLERTAPYRVFIDDNIFGDGALD